MNEEQDSLKAKCEKLALEFQSMPVLTEEAKSLRAGVA